MNKNDWNNWIRENDYYLFLLVCCLIFLTLVVVISSGEGQRRQAIIDKCTPNPDLFECQLYLAEKEEE